MFKLRIKYENEQEVKYKKISKLIAFKLLQN